MGCKNCKNCSCGKKEQEEEKVKAIENELEIAPTSIVVGEIRGDKVNEFMNSIPMKADKSPITTYHGNIDSEDLKSI
ncbi:hypothetical protein D3C81_08330 [compost metagenome]